MFRLSFVLFVSCLLTTEVVGGIMGSSRQVIDFTQPDQAAGLATWSNPKFLGCTKDGFGWDGEKRSSRDGWLETTPLSIGTNWRPTQNAGIRVKLQTNYPAIVPTGAHGKTFYAPTIYIRYSSDRVHWSDWQQTDMNEDPRAPGEVLYTTRLGVPRRASQSYRTKFQEWWRRDDIAWASDEDEFCRWLVKRNPAYFATERPFVGYVQFLLESSFKGGQRLTQFNADVTWSVSGMHVPAKSSTKEKRPRGWNFRGVESTSRQQD